MLLTLVFLIGPRLAFAIPQFAWGPDGIVISSAPGQQTFMWPAAVRSGNNSTLLAWHDVSSQTVFAQRVTDDGIKLWGSDGIRVTTSTQADLGGLAVPDGAGGMLVTFDEWDDSLGATVGIFVQRIDQNGNRLFGDFGRLLSTGTGDSLITQWLIPDGANGGILDFDCDQVLGVLCAQRFDNAGNRLWGTNGIIVSTTMLFGRGAPPASDGANGVIVAWNDKRKNNPSDRDIYIQRIDAAGTKRWGVNGTPVETGIGNSDSQIFLADGAGGVFGVWTDNRTGNRDIYAQRFDSNGTALWAANGIPIVTLPGGQYAHDMIGPLPNAGGFIVFWSDDSNGNEDLYAQRVTGDGQIVWNPNGIPIATSSGRELRLSAVSDGLGVVVLGWLRLDPGPKWTSLIQRINSQGQRLWGTGGAEGLNFTGGSLYLVNSSTFIVAVARAGTGGGRDLFVQKIIDLPGPEPPSNLSATPFDGRRIRLDWGPSPSTNVSHYNIYFDSGTGIIDYSVRITSVPASSTTFVTAPLTAGVTYKFGVRTVDTNGVEELNTHVVASAMAIETLSVQVKAAIKVPQSGKKVTGNRLTIVAELVQGSASDVKDIRFQYRDAITTTTAWQGIIGATIQHPNPDTDSPYFLHWDVVSFPEGTYELRAIATSRSDIVDPSPATIFITIDHADPEVQELVSDSGVQKRQTINATVTNIVQVGDPQAGMLTKITVPPTAINTSSTTLRVRTSPAGVPAVPEGLGTTNIFREITLESGQTVLSNSRQATITMAYPDADDNGILDGTVVSVDRLALYRFNTAANRWDKLSSAVDRLNKTVTAQTPGFSLFGFFSPAAANLSDVLLYPIPWVPNDGNADNGKPFNSADATSGIVFDNLTQSTRIQIFTVTGELVWERVTDASSGKIQWDGKNRSGRDVASGGYFAVITDTATGSKVTRKIAIIR